MADPIPSQENTAPSIDLQEVITQAELPADRPPAKTIRRGLQQTFRALRHRNFRLFISGQAISLVGTWMQNVAQAWLVYRLTHSELLLGTAWFCTQIPVFALGSLGGLACDRYSRWKIVVFTQVLSLFQALGLALLTLSGRVQVWHVLAFALLLGCINAFDIPARQSLVIQMTSKDDLLNAISLNSALFNSARVVGPAIAGLVVALLGEGMCFLVNAISFVAVIVCLLAMRLPPFVRDVKDSPWSHLIDGFRYGYRQREVRTLLWMMSAMTIGGMPAMVLMPFFADAIFHRGSQGLGFLMGAMGVGAVVGTLVLAWRVQMEALPRVILWSSVTTGTCLMVFALSNNFYFSLLIMPLIGFSTMRQLASANTMIQSLIPDEYRGRIMALYSIAVVGIGPFGSLAAGAMAHHLGARVTVIAGGSLYLIAALVYRAHLPALCLPAEARLVRRSLWVLLLAALLAGAEKAPENQAESRAIFAEIDKTLAELASISELTLHKKVPSALISKEKVNAFLKKKVKEVSSPSEVRAEELTLKKFGFVPPDFDLAKSTVDVLTEQAAAFYDYHAKRLYITDWTPSSNREAALAHELAHALADQHFNLNRFIKKARESDDGALARMAVMEGQATWLMSEFLARRMGQTLVHNPELAQRMNRMSDSGSSGEFPVFEGSPLYIRATLIFPYSAGMTFQQSVVDKDGKAAFSEVFRRAPVSTQQIIHPDKYFAGVVPTAPELPKPASARGYKGLIGGTFGELDHQILLQQFTGNETALEIAPHWRGGRYELVENRKQGRILLLYASQWDDAEWARKFLQAYRRVLAAKWKKMEIRKETADSVQGRGDDGDFVLRLEGATVTSIEGLEPAAP